ncbi:MAG: NAD(P)-dependent oxidoreductase [Gemmatimonadaceae bacterium]
MTSGSRIAFLGLGRMGHPMASRILAAGYPLAVWNRTTLRARDLADRGATLARTPAAAVRDATVVVMMLADPSVVGRILLGEDGVLGALPAGATVVDCSTVGPDDSRNYAASCAHRDVRFVDAPVLGSVPAAQTGSLTVLAGGDAATVDEIEPILLRFGRQIVRTGAVGSGSALKLVMNVLVGGLTELMAEAFVLAERSGLAKDVVRDTLASSVLASPFVGYKAPQLLDRNFAPLFTTRLMLKDLDLALRLARDLGLVLPATQAVRTLYGASAEDGGDDQDFSAVIQQLDR